MGADPTMGFAPLFFVQRRHIGAPVFVTASQGLAPGESDRSNVTKESHHASGYQ